MRVLLVVAALAGCYNQHGFDRCTLTCGNSDTCPGGLVCVGGMCASTSTDTCSPTSGPDAPVVGGGDARLDGAMRGSACDLPGVRVGSLVSFCFDGTETGSATLGSTLGSDSCTELQMQMDGTYVCVIAADDITIAPALDLTLAVGTLTLPVALIARDSITVSNSISLDSIVQPTTETGAAGADYAFCAPLAAAIVSGAAGGSFIGSGGDGGDALSSGRPGNSAAPAVGRPTVLRGGCPGGAAEASPAAHSGGAIYIAAGSSITFAAGVTIDASGAGGFPSLDNAGGAGGASGGMIMVEAQTLTGAVVLGANGGAGAGAGGENGGGTRGGNASPTMQGIGGDGADGTAGAGGNGSFKLSTFGAGGGAGTATGGGGGGGAGIIILAGALSGFSYASNPAAIIEAGP